MTENQGRKNNLILFFFIIKNNWTTLAKLIS